MLGFISILYFFFPDSQVSGNALERSCMYEPRTALPACPLYALTTRTGWRLDRGPSRATQRSRACPVQLGGQAEAGRQAMRRGGGKDGRAVPR